MHESQSAFLPEAGYVCVSCGTGTGQAELNTLPSARCANCGFTVFAKARSRLVKQVKAV